MRRLTHRITLAALAAAIVAGCASTPEPVMTGFLSDYSRLEKQSDLRQNFISPKLGDYDSFIVDPVVVTNPGTALSPQARGEAVRYFHRAVVRVLESRGVSVVSEPGVGVARMRIALTDVAKSAWWKKMNPVMKSTGAGTGGLAIEAEVIDSITAKQLAASVQAGSGNQFDFTAYSTLADVKNVIDAWAQEGAERLSELRANAKARK